MKALASVLGAVFVLSFASLGNAQSDCDAGKLKEYGKKVSCLAKVDAKASKKGALVDAAKEQRCADKFAARCAKAEARGDCTSAVESCAALMIEADICRAAAEGPGDTTTTTTTPTTTTTLNPTGLRCCSFGTNVCQWATPADCSEVFGTLDAEGTSCDGASGTCTSSAPLPGPCCQFAAFCIASPAANAQDCQNAGGVGFADPAICTIDGNCL